MIQRIQTLYLLFVTILSATCACLGLGRWIDPCGKVVSTMDALEISLGEKTSQTPLMGILVIVTIITIVAIFLYKERMKQARLCMISLLLLICWYVAYGVYIYMFTPEGASFRPEAAAALPFAGIVFAYLAWRAILRDEFLVRSLDRLR